MLPPPIPKKPEVKPVIKPNAISSNSNF
jgi:hypothetical protein